MFATVINYFKNLSLELIFNLLFTIKIFDNLFSTIKI